MTALFSRLYT